MDYIKKAAPVGEDMPDHVLLDGPVRSDEGGLYRHGFYLIEPIRDLLSGRVEGYVLMQFSEKVLYDSYSGMRGKDRKFCIVSSSGILVSGENKSEIGGWPAIGEPMGGPGQESGTSGFIPGAGYRTVEDQGQDYMYFYENILGTD